MKRTIATASDSKFFRILTQFIYSYWKTKEYENSELICYDLGFTDEQRIYLADQVKRIPNLSIRKFDFTKYPAFVKDHLAYYAWKPIIIDDLLNEVKTDLLWLDSATILFKPLDYVWDRIKNNGFYTPIGGSGKVKEWTHDDTLKYMDVSVVIKNERNMCGCMCGFSYASEKARELVSEWKKLCLTIDCLAPKGADRTNHKFDQPILTILLYQYHSKYDISLTKDEVNISSKHPINFLSVRNKVSEKLPIFLNPLSVFYFKIYQKIDILVNRIRS